MADLKIAGFGKTRQELFVNLAEGMLATTAESRGTTRTNKRRNFRIGPAPDYENLLVNFLNEIWFLAQENSESYTNFDFKKFDKSGIKGSAKIIPQAKIKLEIKSATFYNLKITKKDSLYSAIVVFDI